jgi:hypothetical protein
MDPLKRIRLALCLAAMLGLLSAGWLACVQGRLVIDPYGPPLEDHHPCHYRDTNPFEELRRADQVQLPYGRAEEFRWFLHPLGWQP